MEIKDIYITDKYIIKANKITKEFIVGFDMLSEKLVTCETKSSIKLTSSIVNLLFDEKAKTILVSNITSSNTEAAVLSKCSERTWIRMKTDHYSVRTEDKETKP